MRPKDGGFVTEYPSGGGNTDYPMDSIVVGDINGITHDENWNYFLEGWACLVGVNTPVTAHAYVGSPWVMPRCMTASQA